MRRVTAGLRGEAGSTIPFVCALAFVAFVVIALAADVAMLHLAYLQVSADADSAAEYGASMIDVDAAHRGVVEIDPRRAEAAVVSAVPSGASVEALAATPTSLCVTLGTRHGTVAMAFVGVRVVDVTARSCAEPRSG